MKNISVVPVAPLTPDVYMSLVRAALAEDVGSGDITTEATVPSTAVAHGILLAKSPLVVAGLDIVAAVFQCVNAGVAMTRCVEDGAGAGAFELQRKKLARLIGARPELRVLEVIHAGGR